MFSNMSFTASVLTHARSIIFVKTGARENVISTSHVSFLPAGWGYCIQVVRGAWRFYMVGNFRKTTFLLWLDRRQNFLENWRIDFGNFHNFFIRS
jgi:hypothetical protein